MISEKLILLIPHNIAKMKVPIYLTEGFLTLMYAENNIESTIHNQV